MSDGPWYPPAVRLGNPSEAERFALRVTLEQLSRSERRDIGRYIREMAAGPPELRAAAARIVERGASS